MGLEPWNLPAPWSMPKHQAIDNALRAEGPLNAVQYGTATPEDLDDLAAVLNVGLAMAITAETNVFARDCITGLEALSDLIHRAKDTGRTTARSGELACMRAGVTAYQTLSGIVSRADHLRAAERVLNLLRSRKAEDGWIVAYRPHWSKK